MIKKYLLGDLDARPLVMVEEVVGVAAEVE